MEGREGGWKWREGRDNRDGRMKGKVGGEGEHRGEGGGDLLGL